VTWHAAMRIVAGVEHVVQRTGDGRTGQVAPCAVCTVHVETRSVDFLVEPQNQGQWFVSGLTSKPVERFLRFGLKTGGDSFLVGLKTKVLEGFSVWASKPATTVW
jgi:hypothetical protein